MSSTGTASAAPRPPFAVLAAAAEAEVVPGRTRTGELELAWDSLAIEIRDHGVADAARQTWTLRPDTRIALQLSRSARLVEPGWLMRSLGRESREEHRLHLELRDLDAGRRLRLLAVVDDPARLEGLPTLDQQGHALDSDALERLLRTALALGATVVAAPVGDSGRQPTTASAAAPSLEATLLGLRSERDAQRDELRVLREERDRLAREAADRDLKARQHIDEARKAELARIEAEKHLELEKRRATDTESELRRTLAERERVLAALTASDEAPDSMKTLDQHNRLAALDVSKLDKLGVRCPACDARGEQVEMVGWSPTMTAAVTNRGAVNTSAEGGIVSSVVAKRLFTWRSAVCPRCGYSAKYFPSSASASVTTSGSSGRLVDLMAPPLGRNVRKIKVDRWVKAPKDLVAADDIILELRVGQALVAVKSPCDGYLEAQLAAVGATVTPETILGQIHRR